MIKIHVDNKRVKQTGITLIGLVCGFKSDVTAVIKEEKINAKSIMKAPTIEMASKIDFIVSGEDEKKAVDAIFRYFEGDKESKKL